MSTTLSYDVIDQSDSDLTETHEARTNLEDGTKRDAPESNVRREQNKREREEKLAVLEYKEKIGENDGASQNSIQGEDVTDFKHNKRPAQSVTISDTVVAPAYKKNGKPIQEDTPLKVAAKKGHTRARFHIRESSKSLKETARSDDSGSEDERRRKKVGKSFREVRRMGLDLMEEVREKGREVRAWTAHKLPHLHR